MVVMQNQRKNKSISREAKLFPQAPFHFHTYAFARASEQDLPPLPRRAIHSVASIACLTNSNRKTPVPFPHDRMPRAAKRVIFPWKVDADADAAVGGDNLEMMLEVE
jgi:hypothetical protein